MKKFLTITFLLATQLIWGQCTINSTNGYSVEVKIKPLSIIPSTLSCSGGYNYDVEIDYDINFIGSNPPTSLYTLQGNMVCNSGQSSFTELPNSGGSGTTTSVGNQWNPNSDCATVTPVSLGCYFELIIQGDGIPHQKIQCDMVETITPIKLISFNCVKNDGNVIINWSTASEKDNDFFVIEKSYDSENWVEVNTINSNGPNGNDYTYVDKEQDFYSYYRLKQIDYNGDYTFSKIVKVNINEVVNVYPNPFHDRLYLTTNDFIIYNNLGEKVDLNLQNGNMVLDVSSLKKGLYYFKSEGIITKLFKN